MDEISVLNLFLEAGLVVKIVMTLLFVASILSWIVIIERYNFFTKIKNLNNEFLKNFWNNNLWLSLFKYIWNPKNAKYMGIQLNKFIKIIDFGEFNKSSIEPHKTL